MPELDRFERSFRAGWIRPYRLARHEPESVGKLSDELMSALCGNLRKFGGIPGLSSLFDAVQSTATGAQMDGFAAVDAVVQAHRGELHTRIAGDVAKSMLAGTAENGAGADDVTVDDLIVQTCWSIFDCSYFAKARINLIEEGVFTDLGDALRQELEVKDRLKSRVGKVAAQLAEQPDARGLRTPNRTVPQQSTEELLDDDLLGSG